MPDSKAAPLALAVPGSTRVLTSPSDHYAPGRIRQETDEQAGAVSLLVADFPEYDRLPHEVIAQSLDVRARKHAAGQDVRNAEGIPSDWQVGQDDSIDALRWSDDA
jgi:hypothetical protein